MPRSRRHLVGGYCYHALNRGNARAEVFHNEADYHAFVKLIRSACARISMRVLAFCLMPNHFHVVVWPQGDHNLSAWMQWLLTTHVRRYHKHYRSSGRIWQGRFKAFPIETDEHLLTVLRYVERNAVRAGLSSRAEDWPWSSVRHWLAPGLMPFLHTGPVARHNDWLTFVNTPLTDTELERLRKSVGRGAPYGSEEWSRRTAKDLGLLPSLRPRGRPTRRLITQDETPNPTLFG